MQFPEQPRTTVEDMLHKAWPVGSVFISVVNTNPAISFGFGTWTAFATGRCLVGVDAGQAEFDTVEETGGSKTHLLTISEMPAHTHVQNAHSHGEQLQGGTTGSNSGTHIMGSTATGGSLRTAGQSTLSVTAVNQNTGNGTAHNNLQPYVTVFMWKRVS